MNNCEWVTAITAIAIAIAKGKTEIEILYLSRLFSQLSASLSLLGAVNPCKNNNIAEEQVAEEE